MRVKTTEAPDTAVMSQTEVTPTVIETQGTERMSTTAGTQTSAE